MIDLKVKDPRMESTTRNNNLTKISGEDIANNSARDLSKDGTWFRDAQGRYVLFRGVNFASRSKLPPYLPITPLNVKNIDQADLKEEIESVKPELDLLKKLGFNIIRLLISWKAFLKPFFDQMTVLLKLDEIGFIDERTYCTFESV